MIVSRVISAKSTIGDNAVSQVIKQPRQPSSLQATAALLAAAAVLNTTLTFHNIWPTPWIRPSAEVSVEIVSLVLALALAMAIGFRPGATTRWLLTIVVMFLAAARYAEVTAPALFGRAINVYWDLPHVPNVIRMMTEALPAAFLVVGLGCLVIGLFLLASAINAALRWLSIALAVVPLRRMAIIASVCLIALFHLSYGGFGIAPLIRFSIPVTRTYAQQAEFLIDVAQSADQLERTWPTAPVNPDIARLRHTDLDLLFFESYGATALDEPRHAGSLSAAFAALEVGLKGSPWQVVSGYLRAPTFGGASWLTHASVLSGLHITDQQDYHMLLTTDRATLVQHFDALGHRTVAVFPGFRKAWPEGQYYRFDQLYDAQMLDYPGPAFGWWTIPDQFSLAKARSQELRIADTAPRFTVFASITSHAPFAPTPPYIDDWSQMTRPHPYRDAAVPVDVEERNRWTDMSPSYVRTIRYNLNVLAGWLNLRSADDAIVIAMGDHQPPAAVSGESARWDVPVHVFAQFDGFLRPFVAAGFTPGLVPRGPTLGGVELIHDVVVHSFGKLGTAQVRAYNKSD